MKTIIWITCTILFYMAFSQDNDRSNQVEKAFDVQINDSTFIQIDLQYNGKSLPERYVSHVETPVCKDGLCYLMVIDIYWDVLGNFLTYDVPENLPLTKFDHVEFTAEDHLKMKEILSNKDSFLRFYALENLIDTTAQRSSTVVDGVSGATHKSIQNDVVGGAVFSTYVLWHIVNGPVAGKILKHTEDRLSDSLMIQLLESSNYHYQYYALNRISEENSMEYLPYIIRLVSNGHAYVPFFAIERIPAEVWKSPEGQVQIINLIGKIGFEMQNELLNRIQGFTLSEEATDVLVSNLDKLSDGQLIKVLNILKDNQGAISDEALSKLSGLTKHDHGEISSLSSGIIEQRGKHPDQ